MKIERRYMAHYLNAAFGKGEASYTRLGSDLEEYSPELTANVEKKSNILGQTSVVIDSYQKQGEVTPYYAEAGDPLFEKLQAIIDGDLVLDELKTDMVEVKLWGEGASGGYPAVREECYIEVVSYGGDTTGYQIPFNVHYTGVKTKGSFDPATKKFTEALAMQELKIDTGVEEFRVNGRGVLRFNPADPNLYHRFFAAGKTLQQYDAELTAATEKCADAQAGLALLREYDGKIKALLQEIFGAENDFDAILDGVSLAGVGANGKRVVQNLLEALTPILRAGAEQRLQAVASAAEAELDAARAARGAE